MEASNELIAWINNNPKVIVYHSDVLDYEIKNAHALTRKRLLKALRRINHKKYIYMNPRAKRLAGEYVMRFALPNESIVDAKHIAVASIYNINHILSWNMKHMVNREALFNTINKSLNISEVKIINPDKFLKNHGNKKNQNIR